MYTQEAIDNKQFQSIIKQLSSLAKGVHLCTITDPTDHTLELLHKAGYGIVRKYDGATPTDVWIITENTED